MGGCGAKLELQAWSLELELSLRVWSWSDGVGMEGVENSNGCNGVMEFARKL
jgi:hypothetical protein